MDRVIVIGGGVAGMAAGITLLEKGCHVTLLERGATLGGNLTGWDRQGYRIDNCLHWLNGTAKETSLRRLWERLGVLHEDTPLRRLDALYTSLLGKERLSLWRDLSRLKEDMYALSPVDREASGRFLSDVKTLAYGSAAAKGAVLVRNAGCNLRAYSERFRHPLLRRFMTDYIGGEYAALGLLFVASSFVSGNADLPAGGSVAAAQRMADRFRSMGGVAVTSCRVSDILLDGKDAVGVLTAKGLAYSADAVVAACDPHITFGSLLAPRYAPTRLLRADIDPKTPTVSALHAAFSCRRADCPVTGTVIFDAKQGRFSPRSEGRGALRVFDHEPSFAPRGRLVLQVLLFVDGSESDRWIRLSRDPAAYRAEKEAFASSMAEALTEAFPSLSASLSLLDAWTPATYRSFTGAYRGDFIGYVMTGEVLPYRLSPKVRGLRNVYLASGWCGMPSGMPTAARSGVAAARRLLRDRALQSVPSAIFGAESARKSERGY